MKKIFSTILILFYLMSSMGYATVQHYCSMMQTDVDMSEKDCCCSSESSATDESCHIPVIADMPSTCCSTEPDQDMASNPIEPETILVADHSDCCETHRDYNQLDDSTINKVVDSSHDKLVLNHIIIADERDYFFENSNINLFSDPSLHLNLPLII